MTKDNSAQVCRNRFIIGEDDVAFRKLRTVRGLEFLHGGRTRMRLVGCFILEDEEMHEAGRIVLALPGEIEFVPGSFALT
jgi:hypothetical protein